MGQIDGLVRVDNNMLGAVMAGKHNLTFGGTKWDAAKRRAAEQDRLRAARKADQAARAERDMAGAATPETVRKLRRDVIQCLHDAGKLGDEQLRAAQEILSVYHAVTAGLWPKAQTYTRQSRGADVADWPASLRRAWAERYKPWVAEAERMMVKPGLTLSALVIDMVVDNMGPKQIERHRRMDNRRVVRLIQAGLHRYAEMAGWLSDADPIATEMLVQVNLQREIMAA